MRALRKNMEDQILTDDTRILHCPVCGAEYSGNAGDYWNLPDDHEFMCSECDQPMELVDKILTVKYI